MLKEWPGCFDDLFHVRNVSHASLLLVVSASFLLCSMSVLATLPYLQKIVHLGHSVQFLLLCLFLHFQVVFCVHCIQCWVNTCQNPVIGLHKLSYNDIFAKGISCGIWLPPVDNISAKGNTDLHTVTIWYDRGYGMRHIGEISVLSVPILLMFPPVGYVRYPQCTANLHCIRVVIIEIWINLPSLFGDSGGEFN